MIEILLAGVFGFAGLLVFAVHFTSSSSRIQLPKIPVPTPSDDERKIHGPDLIKDNVIECYEPATGHVLDYIPVHNANDVTEMVEKARKAQAVWVKTSFEQRRKVLQTLSAFILEDQKEIAAVASRDSGKTFIDAFFGEILTTLEKIQWLCTHGEAALRPEFRPVGWLTAHKLARVEYVPRGVVAAIVSWNYPFHNVFGPITSALFAGNAIIIKCSEHVAWSTTKYYAPIIHQILSSLGHSQDLVQFVVGDGRAGEALVRSGIDKVTFIGSPGVGKKVMEAASANLTPVCLELGGKDAAILCEDADLSQAVPIIMRGTFQNCGQNCIGLERIIIHEKIYEDFISRVQPLVERLTQGPPLTGQMFDAGATVMATQLSKIQHLVNDAVEKGARLLVGGHVKQVDDAPHGQYYAPTLLVDVRADMLIAQEEVFGPVMTVIKYQTDREALDIVNSSPYGLGGSIFTASSARAHWMASHTKTGMLNINDFAINYLCQSLPFGGVKSSGFGRFAGVEGLRDECTLKSVTSDKLGWMKTRIPPVLDYPASKRGTEVCIALSMIIYGQGLKQRFRGIRDILKAFL